MKKILFVDDEPRILDGLGRMLRKQRKEWDMTFVGGGQEALDIMAEEPFDVLVSDMRMPGINGATLLKRVQEEYPSTVRIVLSGHTELEAALRAVPVAHQFLMKPCDSDTLREVITRAIRLRALLNEPSLLAATGSVESLPALPRVYNQLRTALGNPEVSLDAVASIVEQSPSITAKILQLVNSSFFGAAQTFSGLRPATAYLGLDMLRNLTLSFEVFGVFDKSKLPPGFSLEREQRHAMLSARIAHHLLDDRTTAEAAFLAATLHDIGKLIMATQLPEKYAVAREAASERGIPYFEMEEEVMGVSHADVGAYLLGIWGMPHDVVEATANHHHPARVDHASFGVLGAVHVATALAREVSRPKGAQIEDGDSPLDFDYLDAVGVLTELPRWRGIAAREAGDLTEEEAA